MSRVALCALLTVSLAPVVSGQDSRATITGMVLDKAGAAVPGAKIRAVQRSTNIAAETTADHAGYYTLPYLQPSTYDLEVTAHGFSLLQRQGITLLVAQKLDLPLKLEVGQVNERVTVTANADVVQSSDASGGLNFDSIQTSEYPLNGRQVYMLMDLTAGVLFTQEEFGSSGYSGTRGWT